MTRAMGRRSFIRVAGAGAAATGLTGILESRRAPAYAQGTRLQIVRWVDFVPAGDEVLTKQMVEAGKALGAEITLERINANDIQPRITTAISSGTGADVFHLLHNWAHLYEKGLADVGDVAEGIGKAQGGYYPVMQDLDRVNGVWRAVPHGIVGGQIAYRKSLFESVGAKEFPKTWEEYRQVGKKLKAKGYPIGQTAGHTFGDAPTFWYPAMWAWGGKEVEKDGRTVAINSKETVESVKFFVGFWKDACDEGGLAWDDTNNNRAFLSGDISATLNGASIYIVGKRQADKIKDDKGEPMWKDMDHEGLLPAGPAGQFPLYLTHAHAIMKYSKNEKAAKEFLRWLHKKENYEKWFVSQGGYSVGATTAWENHPMWTDIDKPLQVFRTAARKTRIFGYAGPSTAHATEVFSKYIVTDMYAKAVQGMAAEESVKWAEGELKKIYG